MAIVDIKGLSKAEVLAALFNASAPRGFGFIQAANGPQVMDVEHAEQLVEAGHTATPDYGGIDYIYKPKLGFDYLYGRPLKVDLTEDDQFDARWFDDMNGGEGAAQRVIDELRSRKSMSPADA